MNDSRQRKLGAILSYVSIILTTLIQLVYTPFLIEKLGQSEYGLYSLVNSIIGYLTVLDLGFGNAIIVYTAKYRATSNKEAEKKLLGMFKIVFYIIGLIAMLLGIILFFNVNNIFGSSMTSVELHKTKIMMLILTFNLGITFGFNIYSSIINAYEKFVFQKILAIASTLMKPLMMIPLLLIGRKSITMVCVITLINVIVMLSNYFYCRRKLNIKVKFDGFDKSLFKIICGYSIWIFLGIIVDKINWSLDYMILGAVSGTVAVSIYSVAAQVNTIFINLSTAISGVLLPKISGLIAKKTDMKILTDEMIKVGRLQFYIVFLMLSGIILFGKQFIIMWIGNDYENAYYCLLLLCIPLFVPLIQNLGISIRQAMNKHKPATLINISVAIFNLVITLFLAKKYGPVGAALGTAIGATISTILINIYYNNYLKLCMGKFWIEIIKLSIPYILYLAMFYVLRFVLFKYYNLLFFIIEIVIYCIIYFNIAYFISMNEYEKNMIKRILHKKTC